MSRKWKDTPTHLPGWENYRTRSFVYEEPDRKKKRQHWRKHKRSRVSGRKSLRPSPVHAVHDGPTVQRTMIAELPGGPCSAQWIRKNGQWRCVCAQGELEWFTRLRHPEQAYQWLLKHHVPFHWIPIPKGSTAPQPLPEHRPAEAYPPHKASAPQGVNTTVSFTASTHAGPVGSVSAGLEQNDVTSPRCLIDRHEPVTPQTDQRCP